MELFTIEENQVIIKPELRLVPQFKKIITRDKDRFKRRALSELGYIYYMFDYKSPYMSIAEANRHEDVIRELKLEDFKVDEELQEAIDKYLSFQETPSIKALKATKEALINASEVINSLNKTIEAALKDKDHYTATEILDKLLSLSDKLPKTITTITTLEEKVQKEQHEGSRIKGGGKTGTYEN